MEARAMKRWTVAGAAAALALAWAGRSEAQYYPYQPQAQPGGEQQQVTTGPNTKLLLTSAVVFGAGYVPAAGVGIFSDRTSDRPLLVPVVGPWIALGGFSCADAPCSSPGLDRALMVGSGLLQGLGAAGAIASIFVPEDASLGPLDAINIGGASVRVAPVSFAGGGGMGAAATF
jgi:hypothetical protein